MRREAEGGGGGGLGEALAVGGAEPAVGAPRHRLNRGFAAEGATAAVAEGAAAEEDQIGFAVRGVDEVGVAGALEFDVGAVARGEDRAVGVEFVGSGERAGARHRDGVAPGGAALGGEEIVIAVAAVEVRRFGEAERGAGEDVFAATDEAALGDGVFLQDDAVEAVFARTEIPELVDEIFFPVVVVKERGIEAATVEIDGIGPLAVDGGAGDEVVVEIAEGRAGGAADGRAAVAFHVGVDEPEQAVGVGEARGPDAAGVRIADQVQLAGAGERAREEAPVDEVARMVDLHAGEPLEGRGGDVVVVADADDGRIGVEAGEDGIADHRAGNQAVAAARRAVRAVSISSTLG